MAKKGRAKDRDRARREAEFARRMRRIARLRTWVGAFGFVPLLAALSCPTSGGALPFCAIPREVFLGLWAMVFGLFFGLTIRLFRERRRYERGHV